MMVIVYRRVQYLVGGKNADKHMFSRGEWIRQYGKSLDHALGMDCSIQIMLNLDICIILQHIPLYD